jgi:hypothetical protein
MLTNGWISIQLEPYPFLALIELYYCFVNMLKIICFLNYISICQTCLMHAHTFSAVCSVLYSLRLLFSVTFGMTNSMTFYFTNAVTDLFVNEPSNPDDVYSTFKEISSPDEWYNVSMPRCHCCTTALRVICLHYGTTCPFPVIIASFCTLFVSLCQGRRKLINLYWKFLNVLSNAFTYSLKRHCITSC